MKHTLQTLAGLVILWCLLGARFAAAQVSPGTGFDDVNDVIFLDVAGETVALVSTFSPATTLELSGQSTTTNPNLLPLGGYLSNSIQGNPIQQVYFFSTGYENFGSGSLEIFQTTNQNDLYFGELQPQNEVAGFAASQEDYLNQIDLTWSAVSGAEGYMIFREDLGVVWPMANLLGDQQTMYTDHGLEPDHAYTYYILAYNLQDNLFLSTPVAVTGTTKPFEFAATSDNEARVTFTYEFDNHLLVGLENQAAYIEVLDVTNGLQKLVYGDELTLTDISEEALLFDNSLVMQGNQHDGVYAKAGLGELNAWTAEMWVNPENMGKHHVLLDGGNILVSLLNSGQYFLNVNGQHYHSQANPITWNDWNHVSITYTGSALRVFHNGEVIPMSPSSALDFQEVNTIANAGLTSQTEFGRLWNFNSNSSLINYHGAFGMIRMWAKARTPDQVAADYKDIYDRAADGLLAQWTFDQETISLPDDIFGQTLTIGTTDDAQFPIRWKPSFAFVDPEVNKSVSVWLDQPLATGTERDYQISIYETGTGRLISRKTDSHLFTHPGAPEVVATPHTRSPYAFQLAISPKSVWADKYILRRHQGSESVILGSVTPEKTGDTYALDALSFTDDFVYQSSTSIVGGGTYTWSATPVYSDLERSFQDEDHQGQSNAHTALDYLSGVQVTAMGNAISLGWNATHLINAGYDTVRIERDGEILVLMPSSEASYTDTLMLFGQDYTYSVLPMKNGQVALAQSGVVGLAPNGAVSGMLVSKKGQYVLPNHPVILQNTTVDLTVDTVTTDAFGALAYSGIVYGVEAGFVWKSLTNEVLKEDTFTLTRLAPQAETPFVLYDLDLDVEKDASVITDLQVAADAVANGLQFTWTSTPSHAGAGQPLFTNVYRDDELIDILVDATRYVDYSATQGEHSYRFKSYYYDDTRTFVYQGKEEVMNVVPPALAVASQFAVATTDDKVVEITWEYPTDAVVSSFVLTRTNEATDVTHVVATLPHQTAGDNYTVVDALGYPGQAYTYILTAHSLATEAHELASQSQGYPMIGVGDVVFSAAATAGSVGAYLDANVSTTKLAWTSWDGLMLLDEEATPLDKAAHGTQTAGITPYVLFQPQVSAANGNLTLAVYKHTDEGLFVSASEDYDYSNAEVASGFILPVPNAPTLATGSPDLQVPVLTASKDGRGRIFVAWEYPHYTEVEFHLAWKTAENSNWNTTVLPNEQRAWLHEHPASQVMEYKLYAQYQDGRRSDEAWDYGIAKTYRQLEGYVYDANNAPQPHAWVGILGAWTQTDSAGYYRLADLELPDQNPTLQYVAPGTHTVSELPLAVTNTPQRIVQHIHTDVTNNLMPAGGEFASVFALADATNITHLTNEVRWTMDGDKFSGVKVYLGSGTNEVADIRQGNPMVYIDSLDDNNAGGAIYWVRPYFTNAMGQKVFLDAGSKTNQGLDYPPLEAPAYASAFTNQALGTVELSWTHRRNNVDGYLIARNDEEIGRVPAGSPHHFVDSTGLPTMVYRYDIYAYVDRSSQTISSQLPITVDALYPA
ncbi:MAG TPA: hypothetical protein DCP28_07990, partial [Cytophagales bacterium]|nr:hypothetical protein [Cytophagales bacterium]